MAKELSSKVWQLRGFLALGGVTPGILLLKEGKVSYVTAEGEQFNVPANEVKEIKWPFIYFGFSFVAVVNGQRYKFSFMEPKGAPGSTSTDKISGFIEELNDMENGKTPAREWRTFFKSL